MIVELLDRSLLEQPVKRMDGFLWVSDLGYHPAKAMGRILNGERIEFPLPTLDAMQNGNMYEADTISRLTRFFPGTVHTQFPLFNDIWSGYADIVLNHGTDNPIIVEHKATDSAYWARPYQNDPGKSYSPVKANHISQLFQYGELYEEKFGIKPKLVLIYRAWKHTCEVELDYDYQSAVTLTGTLDRNPFERQIQLDLSALKAELEFYYKSKRMPTDIVINDKAIDPQTWNYPEERGGLTL